AFRASNRKRVSLRYVSTLRINMHSTRQMIVTVGADERRDLRTTGEALQVPRTTGALQSANGENIGRYPTRNNGGFLQTQLTVVDGLTLTYGMRAEWNP